MSSPLEARPNSTISEKLNLLSKIRPLAEKISDRVITSKYGAVSIYAVTCLVIGVLIGYRWLNQSKRNFPRDDD